VWWSSSRTLRSGLSLWSRWRELGGEREQRECSGLLADTAYSEPTGLSSLRGDPETRACGLRKGSTSASALRKYFSSLSQNHSAEFVLNDRQNTRVEVTG